MSKTTSAWSQEIDKRQASQVALWRSATRHVSTIDSSVVTIPILRTPIPLHDLDDYILARPSLEQCSPDGLDSMSRRMVYCTHVQYIYPGELLWSRDLPSLPSWVHPVPKDSTSGAV